MTLCLAVLLCVLQYLAPLVLFNGDLVDGNSFSYVRPLGNDYFGTDQRLKCNCVSSGCFQNGTCKSNNTDCLWGWFGPLCQFRDVALDSTSTLLEAIDNNAVTCGSNKNKPIILTLLERLIFTWLRIEFDDSRGKPDNISLELSAEGKPVDCQDKKDLYTAANVIDISCLMEEPIDSVNISWTGSLSVCTVNINGGRNMAIRTNNTRSSSGNAVNERDSDYRVVDGKYGPGSPCAKTSFKQDFQFWDFNFDVGYFLHTIVLWRQQGKTDFSHMHGFRLDVYSETDILALHSDYVHSDEDNITIKTETIEPVTHIRIVLGNRDPKQMKYIELCEIEAFGDCAPPYFGLYCEGVCGTRCKDRRCHYNGFCYHCLDKKLGKRCLDDIQAKGFDLSQGEITAIVVGSVLISCALCCISACLGRLKEKCFSKKKAKLPVKSKLVLKK